jgi:hypothetical protein
MDANRREFFGRNDQSCDSLELFQEMGFLHAVHIEGWRKES